MIEVGFSINLPGFTFNDDFMVYNIYNNYGPYSTYVPSTLTVSNTTFVVGYILEFDDDVSIV